MNIPERSGGEKWEIGEGLKGRSRRMELGVKKNAI